MPARPAMTTVRVLTHQAHSVGNFIRRPDLNADNIGLVDQIAVGLDAVSETVTAVLDAWDELIPVIEDELRLHPQAPPLYAALTRLAELEGRRASKGSPMTDAEALDNR